MRATRRELGSHARVGAVFVALAAIAAAILEPTGLAQSSSPVLHQYRVDLDGPTGQREHVLVTFPRLPGRAQHPEGHRWPVVVALHGLGEAQRGIERGYLGWNVDYALPRAYEAMLRGRLSTQDLGGFVRPAHLARLNAWLADRGFSGVAVVTPYTPAIAAPEREAERRTYGDWLAGPMLRAVRAAYPGLSATAAGTAVDGVSLGGRLALEIGFRHPEAFGAVGGIQPAVRGDAARLAALVRPEAAQRLRLLSSDGDAFLPATRELSQALAARSIPHDLLVVPGPHDYAFNRGPGAVELLRFAQTALRPEATRD